VAGNEIPPIPELPHQIVEAINENRLVVFIGAGFLDLRLNTPLWT